MVFSSLPFIFAFLPFSILLYYFLLKNTAGKFSLLFLLVSSLFFYAYWKILYVCIILFSIIINFLLAQIICKVTNWKKSIFILGICINLLLLGYFKYTDFLLLTLNDIFQLQILTVPNIMLPIGISFYTFQQIAYLSDVYTGKHDHNNGDFFEYAAFICFFPQLIAGPIVHHSEVMPQFFDKEKQTVVWENIYNGLYFFSIGLAKKVLIADSFAPLVKYCFDEANVLTFLEALFGVAAYTLQLYFDFSGYADMAIGCALFFNIKLPFNFNSPYRSLNIQDFWRRWHITLSRWLRVYLYVPLGGNKSGEMRTMGNLFITFFLGGIWHGAGWTFIVWGVLHALALIIHRVWSRILNYKMPIICAWFLTFFFISLAWIPFRATSLERVTVFIKAFLGCNGFFINEVFSVAMYRAWIDTFFIQGGALEYSIIMFLLLIGLVMLKNSQELIVYLKYKTFRVYIAIILTLSMVFLLLPNYRPEFIYFQF